MESVVSDDRNATPFAFVRRDVEGAAVIEVRGDIDLSVGDEFRQAMDDACSVGLPVLVDMAKVTFCDTTGLTILVGCRNLLDARGDRLIVAEPGPAVHRVMDVTGLVEVLGVCEDRREALARII
jgi:anti-sigma B factor antagonist